MEIENREITEQDYLSPATYIPNHANGNAGHKDCEQGVIINADKTLNTVKVLYCKPRTVQSTDPENLVWG